jgi:hypothetical protein
MFARRTGTGTLTKKSRCKTSSSFIKSKEYKKCSMNFIQYCIAHNFFIRHMESTDFEYGRCTMYDVHPTLILIFKPYVNDNKCPNYSTCCETRACMCIVHGSGFDPVLSHSRILGVVDDELLNNQNHVNMAAVFLDKEW